MPRATVDIDDVEKFPLTTCEGGFVTLRRLPYGAWLKRQEMALQMKMHGMERGQEAVGELAMANRKVTEFEYKECIVEHNLEDANGQLLDFRSGRALDMLNPKIGNEISSYISQLHEFEDDLPN